eukprot:TRINITY_DN2917_c0_g2_i1.p1 TRINITY_DN2917_c0_g2~~TRINITY_DN2917_c0_g2_i1.p1  ORF type:complete len:203 (-),score=56.70 TRINITY_DN2917_c0_g2_i1:64-672(-)
MKNGLEAMARTLFGDVEMRWNTDKFPFTHPSWELEIKYEGDWLEVLGCGIIKKEILDDCGKEDYAGWAFGLGLERLAMILFNIKDIRLFWSTDPRFLDQFKEGKLTKFLPWSKYPKVERDVSFWTPDNFHDNDFFDIIRGIENELVEDVRKTDEFYHPKKQRMSKTYRVTYRSMDRSLTNEEVNVYQKMVRKLVEDKGGKLR